MMQSFWFDVNFLFLFLDSCSSVFSLLQFPFYFFDSMARTKLMPKKEREGRKYWEWRKIGRRSQRREGGPLPCAPPSPAKKPSPMREVEKMLEEAERWVEARWLEEVGRSPSSLPTQQLAQMAVEAGPYALGRSQLRGSSTLPWEAKPPRRNSSRLGK